VRTLLNIIWFVFSGFWLWLAYMLAGIICCVLIITIPWGIASFRMASYAAWPFGRELIDKPSAGIFSFLGNVIWVIVAGWWIALTHIATGILLCITIIGIPLGIANFKLIPVSLMPLGKQIVRKPSRSDMATLEQQARTVPSQTPQSPVQDHRGNVPPTSGF
jgi:uncharacterized membrane protein YccF (DUF307 family)